MGRLDFIPDFSAEIKALLPFNSDVGLFVVGVVYFIALFLILRTLGYIGMRIVDRLSGKTKTTFDDHIIEAAKSVMNILVIFLAAFLAFFMVAPEAAIFGYPVREVFIMLGIILAAHIAQRFVLALLRWYEDELAPMGRPKRKELFSFINNIIKIGIYATALTIVLARMGIEIGPLLAGLGVAGLAVALALQDSLTNLFAGIHILADKPFKVGDFIIVDNDESKKGYVEEIGWRSTRIRFPQNNVLIVPNAKLASSQIINTYQPSKPMSIVFTVGASYEDKPDKVIKVINRVIDRILKNHPDIGDREFKIVRLADYKDSSIDYVIVIKVKEFMAQYGVMGEVKRQIYYEFEKEGITIPFPQTDVHLFQQKGKKGKKAG
ncbi:hypothetical protein DRN67_00700 [Candidatus Micrarchaeota archaeon]|nr:MAG: hypothetical protein DRN67_00700 [Candidatus Micrarchaeota archaeon]